MCVCMCEYMYRRNSTPPYTYMCAAADHLSEQTEIGKPLIVYNRRFIITETDIQSTSHPDQHFLRVTCSHTFYSVCPSQTKCYNTHGKCVFEVCVSLTLAMFSHPDSGRSLGNGWHRTCSGLATLFHG